MQTALRDRTTICCAAIVAFLTFCNVANSAGPNVVIFLADDLGWTGLGCFGSDLHETPHLDRLASEGVKFTEAYSACTVCSPSRAAILTGKYPARLHLTDFIAGQNRPTAKLAIPDWTKFLKHEEVTIAEALKAEGYKTAQVGKWHLDPKGGDRSLYEPVDHGFDRQVLKPPARGYFMTAPAGDFKKGDYTTDYLAAEAVKIVDEWKDGPFFLYFAFHVPHTPIQGKSELVEAYASKVKLNAIHDNPTYAAMVQSLDDAVGNVREAIARNGLADNTVILFTSDNGGLSYKFGQPTGIVRNDPLRRGKGAGYEGGVRTPLIVKWPGVTPSGAQCDEPVLGIDFYPTILEITGASGDANHNEHVDGLSLVPLLKDPNANLARDAIFWHYPHYHAGGDAPPGHLSDGPYAAIRTGDWKLVEFYEDARVELYNLRDDLSESNDLAEKLPRKASELRRALDTWRTEVSAQLPTPNPNYRPD